MTNLLMMIGIPVVVILALVVFLIGYTKATPDIAKVISGIKKEPRTIIGKAGFRWPILERVDGLYLKLISVDVKTNSAVPTADYINIMVDSNVNIQVSKDPKLILLAERNFLNRDAEYISRTAREVLEGNMREIVGQMTLEQMVSDRKLFADKVRENAGPDLAAMGLDIISFNVQNFIDENRVIENLGVDNIVKIQKKAAISKAESERDIAQAQAASKTEIAKAEAAKDLEIAKVKAETDKASQSAIVASQQAVQEAKIASEQVIIEKENAKALKQAELEAKTNAEKAKADAAYAIQEQEQRKSVEEATANANLIKQEKEVELRKKQAEIQEQELDAQIKKQADAEKYAVMQRAEAELFERQKAAEAKAFEAEQNAKAQLIAQQKQAEAEKYQQEKEAEAVIAKSEAEKTAKENAALAEQAKMEAEAAGQKALADAIAAKGKAEADAIKAKGLAEAEAKKQLLLAEAEGIEKKAEAQAKMQDASITEMQLDALKVYFEQLPEIAAAMSKPLENIDKITMYGEGDISKFMSGLTSTFKQVTDGMSATGGINLQSLVSSFLGNKIAGATNKDAADVSMLTEIAKKVVKD